MTPLSSTRIICVPIVGNGIIYDTGVGDTHHLWHYCLRPHCLQTNFQRFPLPATRIVRGPIVRDAIVWSTLSVLLSSAAPASVAPLSTIPIVNGSIVSDINCEDIHCQCPHSRQRPSSVSPLSSMPIVGGPIVCNPIVRGPIFGDAVGHLRPYCQQHHRQRHSSCAAPSLLYPLFVTLSSAALSSATPSSAILIVPDAHRPPCPSSQMPIVCNHHCWQTNHTQPHCPQRHFL